MSSILTHELQRFRSDPEDAQAFGALEEALFRGGQWDALVRLYEQRLTAPSVEASPGERARLFTRLGGVWAEQCDAPERALACYRTALSAEPRYAAALAGLRRLHAALEQWEVALQVGDEELALELSPDERAALLCDLGEIWLGPLDDPEQALAHFDRGLALRPGHAGALAGRARSLEALGRYRAAAGAWERAAEQSRGTAAAAAHVALAHLLSRRLGQPERAAELCRRALALDPRHARALDVLAGVAREAGDWYALAELHEQRFALAEEDAGRAAIALEAGRLHLDRLQDPKAARRWLSRAAELAPGDVGALEALVDLEREACDDAALRSSLERLVDATGDPPVSALLELASLVADAGQDERALWALRIALDRDPDDALVWEALTDVLARLGRDSELVECLERRVALAAGDPTTCVAALAELAGLYADRLGDPAGARHALERALALDPRAPGLVARLARTYRESAEWERLRSLLESAGHSGREVERADHLCALGELLRDHFREPAAAGDAFEAALALDPASERAHAGCRGLAEESGDEAALARALEREAEAARDPERLARIVPRLVELLERRGDPEAALGWLERRLASRPDDVAVLRETARIQRELGRDVQLIATLERLDPLLAGAERLANRRLVAELHARAGRVEECIAACRASLAADPEDLATYQLLGRQLEKAGRLEELAEVWRAALELAPEAARADGLRALVDLQAERLGDLGAAIEVAEEWCRRTDTREAEERLCALLERAGRFEELAERLAQRTALEEADGPHALDLALRRAQVLVERLGRFEDAAETYRAVLASDPDRTAALEGLEHSLRSSGDASGLAELLAERVQREPDPALRERMAEERARLLEEALDEPDAAAQLLAELARGAVDGELRARAAERLERLLEREGRWLELRSHLESELRGAAGEAAVALHERLGLLCRDRLSDDDSAVAHLEEAAALAPGVSRLWHALAELYARTERLAELARVLEAEIEAGPPREREIALRSRLGALARGPLGDAERARRHYARLFELEPRSSAAIEFLVEEREREGRSDEVLELLATQLAALEREPWDADGSNREQRAALRLRIAELRAGPLEDLEAAIATLEPALGELGSEPAVAEPLVELYGRAGRLDDQIALCRRVAARREDADERARWLARLAEALRASGRPREAAESYRDVLTNRPGDREARTALCGLYRQLDEPEPLARLLEAELGQRAGPDEVPLRLELCDLLAGRLARRTDALRQLRRILQLEPAHATALGQLAELAETPEPGDGLREVLDEVLVRPQPPHLRRALLASRGLLLAADEREADQAVADLREALRLDPGRGDVRDALRQLLEVRGDWAGVLDCMRGEAERAPRERHLALYERAAEIAWREQSPDSALPWLERLRQEAPEPATVLARMAEAHRLAGRFGAYLRCLEEQATRISDPAGLHALHVERAHVLERELHSPARAARALEDARRVAGGDPHLLRELDRLYRQLGRGRERASVLEELIRASTPPEAHELALRAAQLYLGELADPRRAVALLLEAVAGAPRGSSRRRELLRTLGDALGRTGPPSAWARCAEEELAALDPDDPVFRERRETLLRALAEHYVQVGRKDQAIARLRPLVEAPGESSEELELWLLNLLRAQGNWIELEKRLGARIRRHPSAVGWLELARLREEKLRSLAAAAEAYRSVLTLEPENLAAIRGLRSVAERLGRWEVVADALEGEIACLPELGRERAALLRRLGDICWDRLHSTTRASRCYAAALEADPEDFAALRRFEALLEAMEDWRGALDLYESEVEVLGDRDPERRQAAWLRIGELARDHVGDAERALRAYAEADGVARLPAGRRAEWAELHQRSGDLEGYARVLAEWCDDPEAQADGSDLLKLARVLEDLDQPDAALARAELACQREPGVAEAWETAARLRAGRDDGPGAVEALRRAAELSPASRAGDLLLRASQAAESFDLDLAGELLAGAAECDAGRVAVQAQRARVAVRRGRWAEAEQAAARAMDLLAANDGGGSQLRQGGGPARDTLLEMALLGGRAARELQRHESAARLFTVALAHDPKLPEALEGSAEALLALGALADARLALEALVADRRPSPRRARHLALLARCLRAAGEYETALERCEAALALDAAQDEAHACAVALHRQAGRVDAGIAALERRARATSDPTRAARHLLEAAEWESEVPGREASAERHLRDALELDRSLSRGWRTLARLLWQQGRADAVLETVSAGLAGELSADERAELQLLRGRALEKRGETAAAIQAYGEAAGGDPHCAEAALSQARLLRGTGDWRSAAAALEGFAALHPGDDDPALAEVLHQLGRLRAGPLEDLEGAVEVHRRANELDPARPELRAALASLLSHRPGDWREALGHLRLLLEADPTQVAMLRAALRVAEARGGRTAVRNGLAILRAVGVATAAELEAAPARLSIPIANPPRLSDPVHESLRALAARAAGELGQALSTPGESGLVSSSDPHAAFRAAVLAAEGGLTAPALLPLERGPLAEVLRLLAALALEADQVHASGRHVNTLMAALGRRTRRALRRLLDGVSLEAIAAVDFDAWRSEVRALAAALAVDQTGCDLRTGLVAMISEATERAPGEIAETDDLTPLLAACPEARGLLGRAVRAWLENL